MTRSTSRRRFYWLLLCAGVFLTVFGLSLDAQEPAARTLTADQQLQARVLQLEHENAELRRAIITFQVQLESIKGPQEQADRDRRWAALEGSVGCAVDRRTLAVTCKPVEAPPKK